MTDVDFNLAVDDFVRDVETALNKVVAETASETIEAMVILSPVWSGSYVSSHRVGINQPSGVPPTWLFDQGKLCPGEYPPKLSEADAAALKSEVLADLQAKIKSANNIDSLYLSNSIRHVLTVEKDANNGFGYWVFASAEHIAEYTLTRLAAQFQNADVKQFVTALTIKGSFT